MQAHRMLSASLEVETPLPMFVALLVVAFLVAAVIIPCCAKICWSLVVGVSDDSPTLTRWLRGCRFYCYCCRQSTSQGTQSPDPHEQNGFARLEDEEESGVISSTDPSSAALHAAALDAEWAVEADERARAAAIIKVQAIQRGHLARQVHSTKTSVGSPTVIGDESRAITVDDSLASQTCFASKMQPQQCGAVRGRKLTSPTIGASRSNTSGSGQKPTRQITAGRSLTRPQGPVLRTGQPKVARNARAGSPARSQPASPPKLAKKKGVY